MRVPQVNERVKEAPASALRAMFAGIGSLLGVSDKLRAKQATAPAAEATAAPETTAAPEATAAPETTIAPEDTAAPETSAAPEDTAAPETTAVPESAITPEDTAAPEDTATPEEALASEEALPVPNYDGQSIASLRARLRNLSADQLRVLIAYEKSHADRVDVISMFERRIAKLGEA
jgi:hypothetical protein